MVNSMTGVQQQKAVGQGLALGALMLGVQAVNGDKGTLESDFRRAWRDWAYSAFFSAVRADVARNDLLRVLHDSSRRRGVVLAYWEGAWPFVPTLTVGEWTADEVADIIDERIPASGWADLVSHWLSR